MLRRRKADVETELPDRTDRNHFVKLTNAMQASMTRIKQQVVATRLASIACAAPHQEGAGPAHDPARHDAHDLRHQSIIKNRDCRDCPKLDELARVLDECSPIPTSKSSSSPSGKACSKKSATWATDRHRLRLAHRQRPQQKRRGEINAFKTDPDCRVFLSTDSGGVGLNLQNASVVINCDLPWNPAKLEQRIARAWRKHQTRPVTVINLVAETPSSIACSKPSPTR
jgi:SNF2 family DNA or RNA helicase